MSTESFPLSVRTLSGETIVVSWEPSYCCPTSILLELLEQANPAFYAAFTTVTHIDPATNEPYTKEVPFTEESLLFAMVSPPRAYIQEYWRVYGSSVYDVRWYKDNTAREQLRLRVYPDRIVFRDELTLSTVCSAPTMEDAVALLKPCYREAFLQTWESGSYHETFPEDASWDDYYDSEYEERQYSIYKYDH